MYKGIVFALAGITFPTLSILKYSVRTNVISGEGTGRETSIGFPMFIDPGGTFKNLDITIGRTMQNTNNNEEYTKLINLLNQFGRTDFMEVQMLTSHGREDLGGQPIITQNMYCHDFVENLVRVYDNGLSFWQAVDLKFRAEKAWIT